MYSSCIGYESAFNRNKEMTSDTESYRVPLVLPTIAFDLLKDAECSYRQDAKFTEEILQSLHAVFGSTFIRAAELLEKGRFLQYQTPNATRNIIKIFSRTEHYTIFPEINFCHCHAFKYQVLQARNAVTCKHVIAAKLAQIVGDAKVEAITDAQFVDILNDQIEGEE